MGMKELMESENEIIAYKIKDGILFGRYKTAIVDLEAAKKAVTLRKIFTEQKSYPNLVSGIDVTTIEKEARDYFATEESTSGVLAGAVMTKSIFQATLFNFFLRVSNPKIPTKLFTDENLALEWLEKYKTKTN
jgi:hypothetical protein